MKKLIFLSFFLIQAFILSAQVNPQNQVEMLGVVFEDDSLSPLQGTKIRFQNSREIQTNPNGFFTFQSFRGDTLIIYREGYKEVKMVIPDTLKFNKYILGIYLSKDQMKSSEVIILPWTNTEKFKQQFLANQKGKDQKNAEANLSLLKLQSSKDNTGIEMYAGPDITMNQFQNHIVWKGMYGPENSIQASIPALIGLLYSITLNQVEKEKLEQKIVEELKRIKVERNIK